MIPKFGHAATSAASYDACRSPALRSKCSHLVFLYPAYSYSRATLGPRLCGKTRLPAELGNALRRMELGNALRMAPA